MAEVLIKNGRVFDPSRGIDDKLDVLISDGRVAKVAGKIEAKGAEVVDASGCLVAPGFIDLHAHFRQPGWEDEETIASGAAAAVKGGFTTVCVMPNTEPPIDNETGVVYVRTLSEKAGLCDVLPVGAATMGRKGEAPTEMRRLKKHGAVGVSDDGSSIKSSSMMRTVLACAKDAGLVVMEHAEDAGLAGGGVMHEGLVSDETGIPGIPCEAESIFVERDVALAGLTGGRLHIAHISAPGSVDAVRRARQRGLAVSAEVTPHHLLLSDELMRTFDPVYKVNPPLRSEGPRNLLLDALKEGVIEAIATDHAPHRAEEKELDLLEAPSGMASIECAFSALYTKLVLDKKLDLATLIERLTAGPARLLGLGDRGGLKDGMRGDVAVIDLDASWKIGEGGYVSLSSNCPYRGWDVKSVVRVTIVCGRVVYRA